MKRQGIFPGILLIGIGLYFLLIKLDLPFTSQILSWPSILIIIGLAFLFQTYIGKDDSVVFPGFLLLFLGIHFHAQALFPKWPAHWAMYTFIVGLAFFMQYVKTKKDGLVVAIILFIVSIIGYFTVDLMNWIVSIFGFFGGFWPILLIAVGVFLIAKRK